MITVEDFTRVNNDVNGNPRYVFHHSHLVTDKDREQLKEDFAASLHQGTTNLIDLRYDLALLRSRQIGGKKFHNKQYGGGIVIQSYNLHDAVKRINEINNYLE